MEKNIKQKQTMKGKLIKILKDNTGGLGEIIFAVVMAAIVLIGIGYAIIPRATQTASISTKVDTKMDKMNLLLENNTIYSGEELLSIKREGVTITIQDGGTLSATDSEELFDFVSKSFDSKGKLSSLTVKRHSMARTES